VVSSRLLSDTLSLTFFVMTIKFSHYV